MLLKLVWFPQMKMLPRENADAEADRRANDRKRPSHVFETEKASVSAGQSKRTRPRAHGNGTGNGTASQESAPLVARRELDAQEAHHAAQAHEWSGNGSRHPADVREP